ncbi:Actin cortical patch SUR7/pH-response regulator PalI [Cordyceps fumosorosea ARSEF 2679]|uniref:Actin cortical patch SUR7/pH-response regulator PalI n=1 Tax=Cordyceps fumosorosea (strain ARSEF 2679) TaxID=1081104 RepID=A0A168D6Y6_CORFA|nr:Actin cortical patch SUR7/pH-response regulator PalI [Cordyceps fumosorosea ARSEF 2679]OAA72238.1 Actin cortical patch SUR7/pH-response regulator PalI [Cordyceps fumosorosea ARSEF 2679]
MLRPATPLTILLTAALALLIISVISAPVSKSIYLGKNGDTIFGVLGRCTGDKCSSAGIGYDVTADGPGKFTMPDSVRQTLSKTLILHPIAAALTLVMLVMAGVSHIHSAAHSARYLLALFIFTLLAFLVALAATIIDFILFVPHTAFGTYLVLAAAVILLISTIVTFSMRRAMVGRKARRRKIAENAEMSGENYYNREDPLKPMATTMSGAAAGADGLPVFASYERTQQKDDQVSDERIPLTQVRTADRSPGTNATDLANAGSSNPTSRDRYGGQLGQGDPYGPQTQGYGPNSRPSRGNMPGYRGGGAPRGGRGGYNGYGSQARRRDSYGRGGMGPRGRGGPYGQPRDGYGGPAMTGAAAAGGVMAGAAMARGGRQGYDQRSAPGTYDSYGNQPANGQGDYTNWGSQSTPSHANTEADLPRAESPPPLPAETPASAGFGQPPEMASGASGHHGYGAAAATTTSEHDAGATGMVHMQQGHPVGQPRPGYVSDGSKYSTDEYVPPRAAWNQASGRRSPGGQSPVYGVDRRPSVPEYRGPTSPLAAGPSAYYEDVEPRYESPAPHAGLVTASPGPIYEDAHAMDGSRSPAGSVRSNFTSVSQRGINPRWNPHHHPMPGNGARRAVQQRQDMLLDNPDFQLAGGRSGKPKHGNPSGLVPGSAYPNAPM